MSSSSLTLAKRHAGVCEGSLIKAVESMSPASAGSPRASSSSYMSSSTPTRVPEYCILVGVRLTCYESWLSMDRGDHPTSIYSVVGASAVTNSSTTTEAAFRVVTNQGTHLWLCPPSTQCRDVWLGAINTGVERQFSLSAMPRTLKPVMPRYHAANMKNPPSYCNSCGKLERASTVVLLRSCAPLAQYGNENRMDLCPQCDISQGLVEHIRWMKELYVAKSQEQEALCKARKAVLSKLEPKLSISATEPTTHIKLTPLSHHVLSGALRSNECVAYCRISPTLERLCLHFSQGLLSCMEFVELLEDAVGIKDQAMVKLKQEAFRANGDMATALKLLADNASPTSRSLGAGSRRSLSSALDDEEEDYSRNQNSTELLKSILEFFLDLLDDGELQSVAFFWPQMLNIHLQMLPPSDASALTRVELMEDFLLTVATKYSIQLAIELIWSHSADLEDATKTSPLAHCSKRKYAVLRFLCELESLLFDFEGGWGGGSVTVGSFLAPSNHQIALLKSGMMAIQAFRKQQPEKLSRSQRVTKFAREEQREKEGKPSDDETKEETNVPVFTPEDLAKEALRIAKNADYLSTHLAFTKRMGDIAERLFHQPITERKSILQTELAKLNSSGTMGGDPLNQVRTGDLHNRIVRIPMNEGHVFRSKERTPVLLLVETLDEAAEAQASATETLAPFPKAQAPDGDEEEKKNPETEESESKVDETEPSTEEENGHQTSQTTDESTTEKVEGDTEEIQESNGEVGAEEPQEDKVATKEDPSLIAEPVGESSTSYDEAPSTPLQNRRKIQKNVNLSGSEEGFLEETPSSRNTLRRFDSPKGQPLVSPSPKANKETVEELVSNVMAKQLNIPSLTKPSKEAEKEGEAEEAAETKPALTKRTASSESFGTPDHPVKSKMSAFGSGGESTFSKLGDTRREVLNSLMRRGMSGSHSLAAGTATAMQRHLQDLERRRAVEILLTEGEDKEMSQDRKELFNLGVDSINKEVAEEPKEKEHASEDDEVMEAIRLLLIQYQVGQGTLSMNDAAKVLAPHHRFRRRNKRQSEGTIMHQGREFPEVDAGDIDPRLVGCGTLPPAVLQALTLRKANMISNGELLELVKKDLEFVRNSETMEANKDKLNEDSAFWGRFAFGERWAEKRSRLAASSPDATKPGWNLIGMIVKANDDLRQEAFVMQLIELCQEAFNEAGLELWLLPYRILSTGRTTGIIEMVRNAMSFDALKKRPGYAKGGLREHLHRMTQHAADPGEAFKTAQRNFVRSLAAYSLLSYLFLFKDRHNGNILLDTAGHVIHIDFGFVFGIAPGGSFSLEISTPFKLTDEMIEVMDGMKSSLFSEFITLFCCGFLALQEHTETFCTLVDVTCQGSTFKCFEGRDSAEVVGKLRERFRPELSKEDSIAFCLDLIKGSTESYGTSQYDYFQYLSQGIAT